jgi:hypothetical protein
MRKGTTRANKKSTHLSSWFHLNMTVNGNMPIKCIQNAAIFYCIVHEILSRLTFTIYIKKKLIFSLTCSSTLKWSNSKLLISVVLILFFHLYFLFLQLNKMLQNIFQQQHQHKTYNRFKYFFFLSFLCIYILRFAFIKFYLFIEFFITFHATIITFALKFVYTCAWKNDTTTLAWTVIKRIRSSVMEWNENEKIIEEEKEEIIGVKVLLESKIKLVIEDISKRSHFPVFWCK